LTAQEKQQKKRRQFDISDNLAFSGVLFLCRLESKKKYQKERPPGNILMGHTLPPKTPWQPLRFPAGRIHLFFLQARCKLLPAFASRLTW
jgi:hypothetical protein